MQDLPTPQQLLVAIADTLDSSVVPACGGGVAHQARVAANLCRILAREAELGASFESEALSALQDLTDSAQSEPADTMTAQHHSDRLYDAILAGDHGGPDAVLSAVRTVVVNKLTVAKPGYADYDFAAETALRRRP